MSDEPTLVGMVNHDVIEDVTPHNPNFGPTEILNLFGPEPLQITFGLTDRFTKEAFPNQNRKVRKGWEFARLSVETNKVKVCKMADIVSNSKDMPAANHYWHKEKESLIPLLRPHGDLFYEIVYSRLVKLVTRY